MSRVYLAHNFEYVDLERIKSLEVDTIVVTSLKVSQSLIPNSIKVIDANKYRAPGSWYTYNNNRNILLGLKKKCPIIFNYNKINWISAYSKLVYWPTYRLGSLNYVASNVIKDAEIVQNAEIYEINDLKFILKYLKIWFSGFFNVLPLKRKKYNSFKYLFLIETNFQFSFLKKLLKKFDSTQTIIFVSSFNKMSQEETDELESLGFFVEKEKANVPYRIPFFNIVSLSKEEKFMLHSILNNLNKLRSLVNSIEDLIGQGLERIVLVGAENTPQGHLIGEIGKKRGVKVFNCMNGIKAAYANNADVNFYKWIVWDNQMKEMLARDCNIPLTQLKVVGHLLEDQVKNHKYLNSLEIEPEEIKNNLVISVFTPLNLRVDKINGLNAIYSFAAKNNNVLVLYRPHPSEKFENMHLPNDPLVKFKLIQYNANNAKETLYDQLMISDLAVVFASTVALESKWIGTPCITYEETDKSILYCVDDNLLKHAGNAEVLNKELVDLKKKRGEIIIGKDNSNVTEEYFLEITEG